MGYDQNIHHRRSIRLKGYDYSQAGLYFVTICIKDKKCLLGNIAGSTLAGAEMELNDFGKIAFQEWEKLPLRFTNMELDVFQIMPNHVHGIIMLVGGSTNEPNVGMVGAPLAGAQNNPVASDNIKHPSGTNRAGASSAPTLFKPVGDIVGAYKSLVANNCLEIYKQKHPGKIMGKLWQRNYHEHIIRDEQSYQKISEYIITNPQSWEDDKFYIP